MIKLPDSYSLASLIACSIVPPSTTSAKRLVGKNPTVGHCRYHHHVEPTGLILALSHHQTRGAKKRCDK